MNELKIKQELYDFYLLGDVERSCDFAEKCFSMINDPTVGYGIFIENMLASAQMMMQRAS